MANYVYEVWLLNNETAFAAPELLPAAPQPHARVLTLNLPPLVCRGVFLLLVRKMTDTKIEQHTNIKFLAKLKKTTTKTY
jgi:hypothetical protein